MKIDTNYAMMLIELSKQYLDENVERYNEKEKKQFMDELLKCIKGDQKYIFDGVYDFLVHYDLVNGIARHKSFAKYITSRYTAASHPTLLDIGAGRLCRLSENLAKRGFNMFAMDPNIRILENEAKNIKVHISKNLFLCDEFAKGKKGTDVSSFDLLVGLEPCVGTEHIIRQGLKYEKPFEVVLCYEAHDALNGKHFKTVDDWFEHILKISKEIEIIKNDGNYIARHINHQPNSNNILLTKDIESEPEK